MKKTPGSRDFEIPGFPDEGPRCNVFMLGMAYTYPFRVGIICHADFGDRFKNIQIVHRQGVLA